MTKYLLSLIESTVGQMDADPEQMIVAVLDNDRKEVATISFLFEEYFRATVESEMEVALMPGCHGTFHLAAAVMTAINAAYFDGDYEFYSEVFVDEDGEERDLPFEL